MMITAPKRNKPLAMVVDDDPSLNMVVCASLKKIGLDVIASERGSQSIELFLSERPDIILMDVLMPDIDGFQACKSIRKSPGGNRVQILMVTGLEDTDSIQKAFDAGADGFLAKPINLAMLTQHVQYALRAGKAFRDLHISRSRLAKTQELSKIGNWQVNLKTGDFFCSSEASKLLLLPDGTRINTLDDFLQSVLPQEKNKIKAEFNDALETEMALDLEYQISDGHNTIKHILNKSEIIVDEEGEKAIFLGVAQDVTQLKRAEEEIRFLAFYDGLTGLANRMLFMDRLGQAISKAERDKSHFALLFLDLDHFKRVNDSLGHHIGDLLLKKVADSIKASIRLTDSATRIASPERQKDALVARLGGDEFTILVTGLKSPELAALIARRILKKVPAVYTLEQHEVSITTSIGISVFPDDGAEADVLLKHADTAMYHAKHKGRNTYQFYMDSMNKAVSERFAIENDLKKAIKNDEFVLYYQPQIRMSDRKIVGAEALIRWRHPYRGMIQPDKFISVAEESGLIIDINQWVLSAACKQSSIWRQQGHSSVRISVNLSGYKLTKQNISQNIRAALEKFDVKPGSIEIELTENILLQDTEATLSTLNNIKNLNLKIALDDFGTGYSSLRYLTSFPVDTIKIDRSFVMGCMSNKNNLVIIKAIIAMGHSLEKKIIAEGIETKEEYNVLNQFGCDEAQGYYFSHPLPENEFIKLLDEEFL